jgi:Domain of unknown function (DUF222)
VYEDSDAAGLLTAMRDGQRTERAVKARRLITAGQLCQQRIAESGDREQWCIDGWEAVAAEVSAELGISRGRASSEMRYGMTLLERLPRLASVCLAGEVDFRVLSAIEYRTGLITDPELLDQIDRELAQEAPHWNALSRAKVAERIDWLVSNLDPEAVRLARQDDVDRHIDVRPSKNGMAEIWGSVRASDGAAFDKRLDELAATVCADDTRTASQRRTDALTPLADGAPSLACNCGSADCPASGGAEAPRSIVLHVVAEAATVAGESTKPGYLPGFGAIPAETVQELAKQAKVRPLVRPQDFTAEPHYRPSRALADFIRCRDLTCRFPGCDQPAERCDIDHTVPYPAGPTHPSNLKLYCRVHHLLKTFYTGPAGWREQQFPDGTIAWTAPTGRTYTTKPGGSSFFPQLAQPSGTLNSSPSGPAPPGAGRGLAMPTRRRTRAADRAARVEWERGINRARIAANPPPF